MNEAVQHLFAKIDEARELEEDFDEYLAELDAHDSEIWGTLSVIIRGDTYQLEVLEHVLRVNHFRIPRRDQGEYMEEVALKLFDAETKTWNMDMIEELILDILPLLPQSI